MIRKSSYFALLLTFLFSQTEPVKDINRNNPRVWALKNAMVHTEPGDSIKDATIIIRDGLIERVGRYIKIPLDAYEIDLGGSHVYPGFIDGWLQIKHNKKTKSPDDHWNTKIRPEHRAKDDLKLSDKELKALHSIGITAAQIIPEKGIFKGKSDLILLNDKTLSLARNVAQIVEFESGTWSERTYPNSLLGVIAVIRQTFLDAGWYSKSDEIIKKYPQENEPIPYNPSLLELSKFQSSRSPVMFVTKEEHGALRSLKIAEEFNLNIWLLGSGYEYRRLEKIKEQNPFIIFPLEFPKKPKVGDPHIALQYSNEQLKHWDMAPDNIQKVFNEGMRFCFTAGTLKKKSDFRKNIQRIVDRGLSKDIALAALTTYPAEAMGLDKVIGKIQPGFLANLVITDGDYFNSNSRVTSLWLSGEEKFISEKHTVIFSGKWGLEINNDKYELDLTVPAGFGRDTEKSKEAFYDNKLEGKLIVGDETIVLENVRVYDHNIEFSLDGTLLEINSFLAFKGKLKNNRITGIAYDGSNEYSYSAAREKKAISPKNKKETPSDLELYFPEGSYGLDRELLTPNAVLIDNANIWTCGPKGIVNEWDILFVNGKIDKVAPDISVPMGSALVIDGTNKYVTPGLIDCHSHSAASSINEGAQAVTAEVRMQDVLFADDINIYRQLGGGLTTANVLHGSANPIGGQNVVIKLRWGKNPGGLIYKNAPQGIKFALGENVTQANWEGNGRYPQTRMGVEQVIRDAFRAAQDYRHRHKTYNRNSKAQKKKVPPRRDLELEALAEILEGKRLLHCHSYRQDEIWMLTRIAEDFGFKIATFQHVLEGYKVAERLAEHGAGASTFSDWWQYKYEVIDAIPYNGTLMANNNVLVSFNSDDDELARRMNTEAMKAVKYGGLPEEEALHFVTINPAKQLKIDKWVGSLEEGKDADFVIWDGPPLSIYSKVLETWIDGTRYWSVDENIKLEKRDKKEREKLIQKILKSGKSSFGKEMKPNSLTPNHKSCCLISDSELNKDDSSN